MTQVSTPASLLHLSQKSLLWDGLSLTHFAYHGIPSFSEQCSVHKTVQVCKLEAQFSFGNAKQ